MSNKNDNLYKYSVETPWRFIIVVVLYVIGAASFPAKLFSFIPGNEKNIELLAISVSRGVCSALPIWLMFETKTEKLFDCKISFSGFAKVIPFFIVALNNFPLFPLLYGSAVFNQSSEALTVVLYILACFCGVLLEETSFRGLIFPALLRRYSDNKNCMFRAALISSALFGATHIVNLFGGASFGNVIMQIGYSFLVGGMCALAEYYTGSIISPIVLHFVYNLGGLAISYGIIDGNIWTPLTVALTASLGVVVALYAIILVFRKKSDLLNKVLDIPLSDDGDCR